MQNSLTSILIASNMLDACLPVFKQVQLQTVNKHTASKKSLRKNPQAYPRMIRRNREISRIVSDKPPMFPSARPKLTCSHQRSAILLGGPLVVVSEFADSMISEEEADRA